MSHRFTIDGGDGLERRLADICEEARVGILGCIPRRKVDAILLGGGYGRGEGGVLIGEHGEEPYNDLEFYICLHGNSQLNQRLHGVAVHHLGEMLTQKVGIEVEFKLITLDKLRTEPVSMFYYDLVSGHRRIHGEDSYLDGCDHHRSAHRIPLHEATRLLMNRCSGLLYSAERLRRQEFGREEADFVGRNLAKAKLALGDVILVARGQYHLSCMERHKRLKKLEPNSKVPSLSTITTLHEQGVEFKLHPERTKRGIGELRSEFEFLRDIGLEVWLWLESKRLGVEFRHPREYAMSALNKCPETKGWKNVLINLRSFGVSGLRSGRYPRERLLNTLPLLLWDEETVVDSALLQFVGRELRTLPTEFAGLVGAYEKIWRQFN